MKLCYTGTHGATYQNIRITELNKFEASASTIDFGLQGQNYGQQVKYINFDHANAGRVTTVAITGADAEKFTVTPTTIPGTGRELSGSATLRVTFDNGETARGENE